MLLSKSDLGNTNIGKYETFLLIAGALTFFWVNGFLKIILPHSAEKNTTDKKKLIFNAFLLLLGFSMLSSLLLVLLNKPISILLLNGNDIPMPFLLSLYILINSPALLIEYIYLINNKSKSIIHYAIIIFTLQIIAVGIPPLLGYNLNTILSGLLIVTGLKFSWLIVVLNKYSQFNFDRKILLEYLKLGAPLVLSTLLSSSARYIDSFIITSQFSPDDFAVFQYGARELPLAMLMANSLSMAMLPKLAKKNLSSPLKSFMKEITRLHYILFPISIGLLLSSHWLFPIVFNPKFEESATIFNVYLLLVISRLLFPQTLLMAKKLNGTLVRASFFEITINVSLSLVFAHFFGIKGVAFATFIAYLFEKIYLAIVCKRKLRIGIKDYIPLTLYGVSSVILAIIFILVEFVIY